MVQKYQNEKAPIFFTMEIVQKNSKKALQLLDWIKPFTDWPGRLRIFYNSARYIDEAFIPWENDKTNFSYQLFTAYWIEWTVQAAPRQLRRHAPAPAPRPCRPGGGGGKEGRQGGGAEGGLAGGPVLAFNKQGKQLTSQLAATQWKVQ